MKTLTKTILIPSIILFLMYVLGFEKIVINLITSSGFYIGFFVTSTLMLLIDNAIKDDDLNDQNEGIKHLLAENENAKQKYFDLINGGGLHNEASSQALRASYERSKKRLDTYNNFICALRTYMLKEMSTTDELHLNEMLKELTNDLDKNF